MSEDRPDPDQLLARMRADEARRARGKLKIFFGAAAGVGKTYAMLESARAQKISGVDVVIGWVETHGRVETEALLPGLEQLPPRTVEYRGTTLREFDLDAALARRPALILVDELAHTNAPGSRHAKRWQDVTELLEAGIDVYTTLNVQHLESLNDVVARVTEVPTRETVPDSILEEAAEVELVDLPPDDLIRRLKEGKVYFPEQAGEAVRRFFRKGNLIALRELALRTTAARVDAQMEVYRRDHAVPGIWPVAERILVCISPSPLAARVVRGARRMAAGLRAEWVVVNVETPASARLSDADRDRVVQTLRLAEQLGAETATLSGHDVAAEVLTYARRRNVTRIVLGKPARPRWREVLFGSVVNELVRRSGDIDVYVITGEREGPQAPAAERPVPPIDWPGYAKAAGVVALCTTVAALMFPLLRARQPHHGVPAGRHRDRVAPGPGPVDPRLRPERGGLRFLLRAPVPDLRRIRHPVLRHVCGHAARGDRDQHAHHAHPGARRGLAPARAPDRDPLRDDPRPGEPAGARRAAPGRGAPHRGGVRASGWRYAPPRSGRPARPPGG